MKAAKLLLSSAEIIGHNEELMGLILLHVEAKPLIRLKCVSKLWESLIRSSEFCSSHAGFHHKSCQPTALLLNNGFSASPQFQIVPLDADSASTKVPFFDYLNVHKVKILRSCNGLILCSSERNYMTDKYFVCNPTIKQFKVISFPDDEYSYKDPLLALAFDPSKSPHYSIICVHVGVDKPLLHQYLLDVYSSETDSWKLLRLSFHLTSTIQHEHVAYHNGTIVIWHREELLCFNLDSHSFKRLGLYHSLNELLWDGRSSHWGVTISTASPYRFSSISYFGESRGRLHMAVIVFGPIYGFCVVEFTGDYSELFLIYCVDIESIVRDLGLPGQQLDYAFSVLSVIRGDREEECKVVLNLHGKAVLYDLLNRQVMEICELEWRQKWKQAGVGVEYSGSDAYEYFHSLICV